ncbi:outer membrane protein assembly factor BamB family protein [Micromonosporaceae bacterium Da 78-11]
MTTGRLLAGGVVVAVLLTACSAGSAKSEATPPKPVHLAVSGSTPVRDIASDALTYARIVTGATASYLGFPSEFDKTRVVAVDNATGTLLWDTTLPYRHGLLMLHEDGSLDLLARNTTLSDQVDLVMIDPYTGRELPLSRSFNGSQVNVGGTKVVFDKAYDQVYGLDVVTARERWNKPLAGRRQLGSATAATALAPTPDRDKIYTVDDSGAIELLSASDGSTTPVAQLASAGSDTMLILDDTMISLDETGTISARPMSDLTQQRWSSLAPVDLGPGAYSLQLCGPALLCVASEQPNRRTAVIEAGTGKLLWSRAQVISAEAYPGERIMLMVGASATDAVHDLVDATTGARIGGPVGTPWAPARVAVDALVAEDILHDLATGATTPWPEPIQEQVGCGWHEGYAACLTKAGDLTVWRVSRG